MVKNKSQFMQLVEALQSGWEIQEPILLGAMWHTEQREDKGVYHFVLRQSREDKTTLLSLPPSPQLLMFLADSRLRVSAR